MRALPRRIGAVWVAPSRDLALVFQRLEPVLLRVLAASGSSAWPLGIAGSATSVRRSRGISEDEEDPGADRAAEVGGIAGPRHRKAERDRHLEDKCTGKVCADTVVGVTIS